MSPLSYGPDETLIMEGVIDAQAARITELEEALRTIEDPNADLTRRQIDETARAVLFSPIRAKDAQAARIAELEAALRAIAMGDAAARTEKLEAALRWIDKTCDVRIHRLSLFDEIQRHAREALEPGK